MKTNKYEVVYHSEKLNYSEYFQVKKNGNDIAAFSSRDFADKFIKEDKATVILRTKKIESYFRGIVKQVYFPFDGRKYTVVCKSYSGGNVPILNVIDFKAITKGALMSKLVAFKNKYNLILEHA